MFDIVCTAMKERIHLVEYLQFHIPNLKIVWDKNHDAMDTFMRAWKEYPTVPSLRIQDDIILTEEFLPKVTSVIDKYPNDVIQFFSMRKADIEIGSRWENGSTWLMNQCHYLPAGMSGKIHEYGKTWKGLSEAPTADDWLMRDYFKEHKIKYYLHCPSLVEHASVYSQINRKRSRFRKSKTFTNPNYVNFPAID